VLQLIRLTFRKLDLELSESCEYDRLSVFDGSDNRSSAVGVYCGRLTPQELIQSSNTTLSLEFTSDSEDTGQGFVVDWQAVDDVGEYPAIVQSVYTIERRTSRGYFHSRL